MSFNNKWQTLTTAELEKILDQAFKAVAQRIIEQRGQSNG